MANATTFLWSLVVVCLYMVVYSLWVMMNEETRKLSKIPGQVKTEIEVNFVDLPRVLDWDSKKLPKLDEITADYTRTGLTVRKKNTSRMI